MSENTKWKRFAIKRYFSFRHRTFELSIQLDIDFEGSNHLGSILNIKEITKE